jgi:H+/Cl- antiporter ClcA
LFSAIVADQITVWWGIEHTIYKINSDAIRSIEFLAVLKIVAAGVAFGAATWLFLQSTHLISRASHHLIAAPWLRPAMGGLIVVAVVWLFDWRQYLGLGVVANPLTPNDVCIVSSFATNGADRFSWLWKILLTAITVGFGFKGGEATPLFYVGSTLGNVLGNVLKLPIDLAAGLGLVAVFASATRTPLACTLMAVELFAQQASLSQATGLTIYALIACLVATCVRCRAI